MKEERFREEITAADDVNKPFQRCRYPIPRASRQFDEATGKILRPVVLKCTGEPCYPSLGRFFHSSEGNGRLFKGNSHLKQDLGERS